MRKLLAGIALGVVGIVAAGAIAGAVVGRARALEIVFGPIEPRQVAFETLVLSDRPNQFLVCPDKLCAAPAHAASPVFEMPAERLQARWRAMIAGQPRVVPAAADPSIPQYDFIQRSWAFRFPDTVTVRFIPLGQARSTLAIYSRSHYGHSDLGVNRARIEAWLAALSAGGP